MSIINVSGLNLLVRLVIMQRYFFSFFNFLFVFVVVYKKCD